MSVIGNGAYVRDGMTLWAKHRRLLKYGAFNSDSLLCHQNCGHNTAFIAWKCGDLECIDQEVTDSVAGMLFCNSAKVGMVDVKKNE